MTSLAFSNISTIANNCAITSANCNKSISREEQSRSRYTLKEDFKYKCDSFNHNNDHNHNNNLNNLSIIVNSGCLFSTGNVGENFTLIKYHLAYKKHTNNPRTGKRTATKASVVKYEYKPQLAAVAFKELTKAANTTLTAYRILLSSFVVLLSFACNCVETITGVSVLCVPKRIIPISIVNRQEGYYVNQKRYYKAEEEYRQQEIGGGANILLFTKVICKGGIKKKKRNSRTIIIIATILPTSNPTTKRRNRYNIEIVVEFKLVLIKRRNTPNRDLKEHQYRLAIVIKVISKENMATKTTSNAGGHLLHNKASSIGNSSLLVPSYYSLDIRKNATSSQITVISAGSCGGSVKVDVDHAKDKNFDDNKFGIRFGFLPESNTTNMKRNHVFNEIQQTAATSPSPTDSATAFLKEVLAIRSDGIGIKLNNNNNTISTKPTIHKLTNIININHHQQTVRAAINHNDEPNNRKNGMVVANNSVDNNVPNQKLWQKNEDKEASIIGNDKRLTVSEQNKENDNAEDKWNKKRTESELERTNEKENVFSGLVERSPRIEKKNYFANNDSITESKTDAIIIDYKNAGVSSAKGKTIIPPDVLDDLGSRFIINVPDVELCSLIRICFQIELAHWFYLDFYCSGGESDINLTPYGIKQFAAQMFQHIPFLRQHLPSIDTILEDWKNYKLSVPTYGGILVSEDLNYCLLVQSYFARCSWGFPKGKINENEEPLHCAVREVYEETGYDISRKIQPEEYVDAVINFQYTRLYIVRDVPLHTKFVPRTRKEIKSCDWFPIDLLPTNKNDAISRAKLGINTNSFFMIIPFIKRLKKWTIDQRSLKNGITETNGITLEYPLLVKTVDDFADTCNIMQNSYNKRNINVCSDQVINNVKEAITEYSASTVVNAQMSINSKIDRNISFNNTNTVINRNNGSQNIYPKMPNKLRNCRPRRKSTGDVDIGATITTKIPYASPLNKQKTPKRQKFSNITKRHNNTNMIGDSSNTAGGNKTPKAGTILPRKNNNMISPLRNQQTAQSDFNNSKNGGGGGPPYSGDYQKSKLEDGAILKVVESSPQKVQEFELPISTLDQLSSYSTSPPCNDNIISIINNIGMDHKHNRMQCMEEIMNQDIYSLNSMNICGGKSVKLSPSSSVLTLSSLLSGKHPSALGSENLRLLNDDKAIRNHGKELELFDAIPVSATASVYGNICMELFEEYQDKCSDTLLVHRMSQRNNFTFKTPTGGMHDNFNNSMKNSNSSSIIDNNIINNWKVLSQCNMEPLHARNGIVDNNYHYNSTTSIDNNFCSGLKQTKTTTPIFTIKTLYSNDENITSKFIIQKQSHPFQHQQQQVSQQQLHHYYNQSAHQYENHFHHQQHNNQFKQRAMHPPISGSDLLALASMAQAQVARIPSGSVKQTIVNHDKISTTTQSFYLADQERTLAAILGIQWRPARYVHNEQRQYNQNKNNILHSDNNNNNATMVYNGNSNNLILMTNNTIFHDTMTPPKCNEKQRKNVCHHFQWEYRGNRNLNGGGCSIGNVLKQTTLPMYYYNHNQHPQHPQQLDEHTGHSFYPFTLDWKLSSTNLLLPMDGGFVPSEPATAALLAIKDHHDLTESRQPSLGSNSWQRFSFNNNLMSDIFE